MVIMHNITQEHTHLRHKKWKEELQLGIKPETKVIYLVLISSNLNLFFNTSFGKNSLAILNSEKIQFYNENTRLQNFIQSLVMIKTWHFHHKYFYLLCGKKNSIVFNVFCGH